MGRARSTWHKFWDRAPRQLKIKRDGKIILSVALASGFAAINTGNNLLFIAWGMVLAAIVISGVLSESTLRILRLTVQPPTLGRVGEPLPLGMRVSNVSSSSPGFALRFTLWLIYQSERILVPGPFRLKVHPKASIDTHGRFVPEGRGRYHLQYAEARTTYPFGFFEKIRRYAKREEVSFWVGPRRLPVTDLTTEVFSQLGYSPAKFPGRGDEFFSLRTFREGEDPRGIHWRTTLRTAKPMVREHEAMAGRKVLLEFSESAWAQADKKSQNETFEDRLARFCSVAEELLERGVVVGVVLPGGFVSPASGAGQATQIVLACAQAVAGGALPAYRLGIDTAHLVFDDSWGSRGVPL